MTYRNDQHDKMFQRRDRGTYIMYKTNHFLVQLKDHSIRESMPVNVTLVNYL